MTKQEVLKQKLNKKIEQEYNEYIEELKKCEAETILDRAYEKVSKEEMMYKIKDKDYSSIELKTLLEKDNILNECYDEWLKSDGNFNEVLEYAVNKRIELMVNDYIKEKGKKI